VPFKKGVIYHCRRVPSKPAGFFYCFILIKNSIDLNGLIARNSRFAGKHFPGTTFYWWLQSLSFIIWAGKHMPGILCVPN
jgi:hypothetical protein